ncbi:hypothetical protein [Limosilactobacillus caccae]|uniref:hypothetical protein n=1 Tax=Limosilactobacillus caccae TaxID=1926284 RepID=UPI0009707502|nr:hypothetical protein [Limosilactobacillus caccae]
MKKISTLSILLVESLVVLVAWYIRVVVDAQCYPANGFYGLLNWLQTSLFIVIGPVYFSIAFVLVSVSYLLLSKLLPRVKNWLIHAGLVTFFLLAIVAPLANSIAHHQATAPRVKQDATAKKSSPKEKAEKTIKKLYRKKGLAGQIRVISASKDLTEANYGTYEIEYTYTETIDGKREEKRLSDSLDSSLNNFTGDRPFNPGGITRDDFKPKMIADSLGATADDQPYVRAQYKFEEGLLQQQLASYYDVHSIEYNLKRGIGEKTPQFKELKEQVLANRKQGRRLGGYYDLDIPRLAQDGVVAFVVKIDAKVPDERLRDEKGSQEQKMKGDSLEQEGVQSNRAAKQEYLTAINQLNVANFWDGEYYFKFKSFAPFTEDYCVKAVIKDSTIQSTRIFQDD